MTAPRLSPEPHDAELIERWRQGDELAASELVRRHTEAVARFLGAAGARDDLEDLVQETFFKAFTRIESFRGDSAFRTWLCRIASNALTDLRRKVARRRIVPIEDREFSDAAQDPHSEVVGDELARRVGRALERLPRLQRDVFLLRSQQELPYEEIAIALGTTPGAARVHYHNAVKKLKDTIE